VANGPGVINDGACNPDGYSALERAPLSMAFFYYSLRGENPVVSTKEPAQAETYRYELLTSKRRSSDNFVLAVSFSTAGLCVQNPDELTP
jgi:hypothetical protein